MRPEQVKAGPQRVDRGRGRRERGREVRDGEHEKTPRATQRGRDDRGEHGGEAANASSLARDVAPQRGERSDAKLQGERSAQKSIRGHHAKRKSEPNSNHDQKNSL